MIDAQTISDALNSFPIPTRGRMLILSWPQARDLGMSWGKWAVLPDAGDGLKMLKGR